MEGSGSVRFRVDGIGQAGVVGGGWWCATPIKNQLRLKPSSLPSFRIVSYPHTSHAYIPTHNHNQVAFTPDDDAEGSQLAPGPHVAAALEAAAELMHLSPSYLMEVRGTLIKML
jgi:hypothetical protein